MIDKKEIDEAATRFALMKAGLNIAAQNDRKSDLLPKQKGGEK